MKLSHRSRRGAAAGGERGGARLNFLITLLVIGTGVYSAYQYAPVSYNAFLFKDFMQETVNKAAYSSGQMTTTAWIESQLRAGAKEYDLPSDMRLNVQNQNGQIVAQAQWTKPIQLPGFIYEYKFDHTVKSSGFINPQ